MCKAKITLAKFKVTNGFKLRQFSCLHTYRQSYIGRILMLLGVMTHHNKTVKLKFILAKFKVINGFKFTQFSCYVYTDSGARVRSKITWHNESFSLQRDESCAKQRSLYPSSRPHMGFKLKQCSCYIHTNSGDHARLQFNHAWKDLETN